MEKRYLIALVALTVSLAVGCGFLFYKNHGTGAASAQISRVFGDRRGWVEIKPRVIEVDKRPPAGDEEPALAGGKSVTEEPKTVAAKSKPAAAKPAVKAKVAAVQKPGVKWCPVKTDDTGAKKIIFNEVAWMGGVASYSDEWIELKNTTSLAVDLAGWQLQNKSGKIAVRFKEGEAIPAGNFYLLERTNDDSVLGVAADKIYSGSLGNSNEALYLFDNNCQLQDLVDAAAKWPAGDNAAKKTMIRLPNFLWQTSASAGGTPKAENK